MHLDLSDEETAALTQELHEVVESDRYPRIRTLRAILGKLRHEAIREPPPLLYRAKGRRGTLYPCSLASAGSLRPTQSHQAVNSQGPTAIRYHGGCIFLE
jgi:hypothetical protein